jgi:hypothetical protein
MQYKECVAAAVQQVRALWWLLLQQQVLLGCGVACHMPQFSSSSSSRGSCLCSLVAVGAAGAMHTVHICQLQ